MSQEFAKGAAQRLAHQKHDQPRRADLSEYEQLPTIEELVEDMVSHGFEESTARASAQTLFDNLADKQRETNSERNGESDP